MKSNLPHWLITGAVLLLLLVCALFWSLQMSAHQASRDTDPTRSETAVEREPEPPRNLVEGTPPVSVPQRSAMPAALPVPADPGATEEPLSPDEMAILLQVLSAGKEARELLIAAPAESGAGAQAARHFTPMAYAQVFRDLTLGPVFRRLVRTPLEIDALRRGMARTARDVQVDMPILLAGSMDELAVLAEQLAVTAHARREGRIGGDLSPELSEQATLVARANVIGQAMETYGLVRNLTFDPGQQKFVPTAR